MHSVHVPIQDVPVSRDGARPRVPQPALSLLAFMMAVGPFGDTEYTPALPSIAHALHADYDMVQFTMTSYLIGSSVSQLIYGPLSDRFGRRPLMLYGSLILIAGSVLCMLSFSVGPLIAGRLLQGIGACAGGVIADAAVRDAFSADRRQRVYAKINAAFAVAPAIGPVAGTYVERTPIGWHGNFAVLTLLAVALLWLVWRYLPETNLRLNRRALQPKRFWRNYRQVLVKREFVFNAILSGCCIGIVYTALIGAPDLVINVLKRGSIGIIIVAISILIAFVIGAGSCAWLTRRIRHEWIIVAGLALLILASAALLVVALWAGEKGTLAMFLAPIGVAFIGVGLVVPVTTAHAMAPFRQIAGAASSMLGFVRMGVAALATLAMSLLHMGSVIDIPIVFLVLTALAVGLFVGYVTLYGRRDLAGPRHDVARSAA